MVITAGQETGVAHLHCLINAFDWFSRENCFVGCEASASRCHFRFTTNKISFKMNCKFSVGDLAEALDEFGVWAKCKVCEIDGEHLKVTFPSWPAEFDRWIEDENELRVRSPTEDGLERSRKRKDFCSFKVSFFTITVLCIPFFVDFALKAILVVVTDERNFFDKPPRAAPRVLCFCRFKLKFKFTISSTSVV